MRSSVRCLFVTLALATACKESSQPASAASAGIAPTAVPAPPSSSATFGIDDSGKHVDLTVGMPFVVRLAATAGTGYSWAITQGDPNILAPSGPAPIAGDPNQQGGPTTQTFSFTAKTPGSTHLEIGFRRPWEQGAGLRTFTADVTVR